MELKPQLCVFMLLIQLSLAVWRDMTVQKGQTLTISCPITNARENHEWKNPEEHVMFFQRTKVLRDERYSINKLSRYEFTISVSNITFKDGGIYTCSEYGQTAIEKKVKVTVLSPPRIKATIHNGKTVIKCTTAGNYPPPNISWQIDDGPEISARSQQQYHEGKKYVSEDQLHVGPAKKSATVKCLVRHPALHSEPLITFLQTGKKSAKTDHIPTIRSSPTSQRLGSAHDRTTVYYSTTDVDVPSTDSYAMLSTASPTETKFASTVNRVPSMDSHLSTSETVLSSQTKVTSDTINNETSTEDQISDYTMTQETTPDNSTGENRTAIINDPRIQTKGNSVLLVFLVTCLIICLLVVVIFFAIKLRRAHVIWKRENEESDPSEESSKSKSSQEDKNAQANRRKGLFNTAFTQYVNEDTTVKSVVTPGVMAATAIINNGQSAQAQTPSQAAAKADIKETEL